MFAEIRETQMSKVSLEQVLLKKHDVNNLNCILQYLNQILFDKN